VSACDEPPPILLLEGIAQFNRREYFEQHETLERLWRAEDRQVRHLYQGILQIGVAFHHLRRLNHHGTVYMLTRGMGYLAPFAAPGSTGAIALVRSTQGEATVQVLAPATTFASLSDEILGMVTGIRLVRAGSS